ncbi:hypothetical protein B0J14DRAFT_94200 [Halenospora varia]|nr:hypothetical protein B0J14DRAFT_94200 [Halenospora varia]
MPLPQPDVPLEDSCSAIFNNTLYSYSSQAFQSLPITKGATWSNLTMGVAVKGGVCVKSTPVNDTSAAALWIVGGTASSSDYQGLQRYNFADQKWETITLTAPVTQNRLWHNAVYLNTSDSILVYAGTQDGSKQATSQTFTIQASSPYSVLAYEAIAPPAISPILIPWTQSKAIYVGGSDTNTKAMLFSPTSAWKDSNATLAAPIYNITTVKGIVINGDDASKTLYTFDMSVSPNDVNRTILIDSEGNPVQNAKAENHKRYVEEASQLSKRGNLTVADWPDYNDTLAPKSTRTAYTIARDQSGLVVISGGNENDVLCMFKARQNCWINATQTLGKVVTNQGNGIGPDISAATIASTPSETAATTGASSSAATATVVAATASSSDPPVPVKILGAVLGSILGVALIFVALLFILRWRRKKRYYADLGHQRRSSGIPNEKDGMDFADRGLPEMSTTRQIPGHKPNESQGSFSSMAILMGRVGHKRGASDANGSVGSDASSQFNKKYKTAISKPIPQENIMAAVTEVPREEAPPAAPVEDRSRPPLTKPRGMSRVRGSTRRSSGWNRYWSGGSSMNILGFGSGSKRSTYEEGSERDSGSQYSVQHRSGITQASALPPPLKIPGHPELNRVASASPTIANHSSDYPLTREMSGQIERSGSISSFSSYTDDRLDAFSSGVPASVHEQNAWTPVDGQGWARQPSEAYTASVYTTLPRNTNNLPQDLRFPNPPPSAPRNDMSWLNLGGDRV